MGILDELMAVNRDAKSNKGVTVSERQKDAADRIKRGTGGFDVPNQYHQGPTIEDLLRWWNGGGNNVVYKRGP
jgi:hypothetical protein